MTDYQGTHWESELVGGAEALGLRSDRHPKRGQADEPDVWIGVPNSSDPIPVVAWKRLVGKKSEGRRKPDGERDIVVIGTREFLQMLALIPDEIRPAIEVQCKWTSRLNVTRTLYGLREWLRKERS